MLTTTSRASRPKDRMLIEARNERVTPGDTSERQATWAVMALVTVGAVAALAYVYLRKPGDSTIIVIIALVMFAYAVGKTWKDLRTVASDIAKRAAYVEEVAAGNVVIMRCEATELLKIEREHDDGLPAYAFQAEPDKILLVQGDVFEKARGFPSTIFEFTYNEESEDDVLSVAVMGEPLTPGRTIPFSSWTLPEFLDDFQLYDGRLDALENVTEPE